MSVAEGRLGEQRNWSAFDDAEVSTSPAGVAGVSHACANDGVAAAQFPISRAGFLGTIDSCVRDLAAWLGGSKAAAHPNSQVAAIESARTRLWQWLHAGNAVLDDGTPIDFVLFDSAIQRVGERLPRRGLPGQENVTRAAWLLAELTHASEPPALPVCAPAR